MPLRPLSGLKLPDEVYGRGPVGLRCGTELEAERGDPLPCFHQSTTISLLLEVRMNVPVRNPTRYCIAAPGPDVAS